MSRKVTCTNHCSQCGRHFHSVAAFDLHLSHNEAGWPVCLDPLDLRDRDGRERLTALTESGECRMYDDGRGANVERAVTVWTLAGYTEQIERWQPVKAVGSFEQAREEWRRGEDDR